MSVVYIWLFVPETRGRTLEEIEQTFSGGGVANPHVKLQLDDVFGGDLSELDVFQEEEEHSTLAAYEDKGKRAGNLAE